MKNYSYFLLFKCIKIQEIYMSKKDFVSNNRINLTQQNVKIMIVCYLSTYTQGKTPFAFKTGNGTLLRDMSY